MTGAAAWLASWIATEPASNPGEAPGTAVADHHQGGLPRRLGEHLRRPAVLQPGHDRQSGWVARTDMGAVSRAAPIDHGGMYA